MPDKIKPTGLIQVSRQIDPGMDASVRTLDSHLVQIQGINRRCVEMVDSACHRQLRPGCGGNGAAHGNGQHVQ
jgi:hypothetical protein